MKKLLANLTIILITNSALIAQADFRKGYLVKQNGDTLNGYVNFQKETVNNSVCNFKRFEIAIPVNYTPYKIKAYGIDGGKQFVSVIYNEKRLFAEYLIKGKVSLLYLKPNRFFIYGENNLVELKNGKTINQLSNKQYNNYKDYLKDLFNNPENLSIDSSKLEEKSLIALVKQYNISINSDYEIPIRPKEKKLISDYSLIKSSKVNIGVLGGLGLFTFKPTESVDYLSFLKTADYKTETTPLIGLYVKGKFSRMHPNWSFQTNALYQESSLHGVASGASYYGSQNFDDIFIDFKTIKLSFHLNYEINIKQLSILPHLGIGYNLRFNTDYYRYKELMDKSQKTVMTYKYTEDVKVCSKCPSYTAGVSFEYKLSSARRLQLNIDYDHIPKVVEAEDKSGNDNTLFKGYGRDILITLGIAL
jgi:hypothetical protein